MARARMSGRDGRVSLVKPGIASDQLRARRLALGLSQADLAKRLGVTANTFARWERGELHPAHPEQTARRLARLERAIEAAHLAKRRASGSTIRALKQSPRHNLPVELSSFIGRQQETDELVGVLGKYRLVTLTGAGGVGKTRLGLRAAAEVAQDYADGVWMVELAPVADPLLVVSTVAMVLGVLEEPGKPLVATLADTLRSKHLLLLLDNCEHLVGAVAELCEQLLRAGPHLRILATSRAALGCTGEVTWRVPSLSLPTCEPSSAVSLAAIERSEAVQLFVERATQAAPGFMLSSGNALIAARICERLDGIPLALELAAARAKVLDLAHLVERLDDRFNVLTGGPRAAPARQQTLRATVEWSYNLLEPAERTLFERLSVFVGGFTPDAAEAVCGDPPLARGEVLDLLAHLVDKSLVTPETSADGTPRHRLLETLRQFGSQHLAAQDLTEVGRLHSLYFMTLAEEAEPHLWSRQQREWLTRLDHELDNLRAALRWSVEHGAAEIGLRLAGALQQYWDGRGRFAEGSAWCDQLPLHDPAAPAKHRLLALRAAAYLTRAQGKLDRARALGEDRRALAEAIGDREGGAWALHHLGVIASVRGEFGQARALYRDCLARFEDIGVPEGIGWSLHNLGLVALWAGDLVEARQLLERTLAVFEEFRYPEGAANTVCSLGRVDLVQGQVEAARARFEVCLATLQSLAHRPKIGSTLMRLGDLARWNGDWAGSRKLYEQSVTILRDGGNHADLVEATLGHGQAALALGDLDAARSQLEESLASARLVGLRRFEAAALASLGELAWAEGHRQRAMDFHRESLLAQREMGNRLDLAESLVVHAQLAAGSGQPRRATRLFAAAAALRQRAGAGTPLVEHRANERAVADLRRVLGESTFTATWVAGSSLSIEQAVGEALAGGTRPDAKDRRAPDDLTARELQVLQLLAAGKSNREVAEQLVLSIRTVERHVSSIYEKIGAAGRTARAVATAHALTHGLSAAVAVGSAAMDTRVP